MITRCNRWGPPCLLAVAAVLGLSFAANAGEISLTTVASGQASFGFPPPSHFLTLAPGNDEDAVRGNFGQFDLTFTDEAPIVLSMTVSDSATGIDPVTEYDFSGLVSNASGLTWIGFRAELISNAPVNGLDFDVEAQGTASEPTLGGSHAGIWQSRLLQWNTTDPFDDPSDPALSFAFDVPNSPNGTPYSFDLQLEPLIIPEPATGLWLAIAAAGLGFTRGRRARTR